MSRGQHQVGPFEPDVHPLPPPPPPAPPGTATQRLREHRAKALELAVQTVNNHELTGAFLGTEIVERGNPFQLADRYLAYINGTHQP